MLWHQVSTGDMYNSMISPSSGASFFWPSKHSRKRPRLRVKYKGLLLKSAAMSGLEPNEFWKYDDDYSNIIIIKATKWRKKKIIKSRDDLSLNWKTNHFLIRDFEVLRIKLPPSQYFHNITAEIITHSRRIPREYSRASIWWMTSVKRNFFSMVKSMLIIRVWFLKKRLYCIVFDLCKNFALNRK